MMFKSKTYWKLYCFIWRYIGKFHAFCIKIGIPLCHGFEGPCFHIGKRRRQRTAYYNDELNWVFLCDGCMKINHKYWNEMWDEYYSRVM